MTSYERMEIFERLLKNHTLVHGNCHLWTGNTNDKGYGTTHLFGKIWRVHILASLFFKDLNLETKIRVRHLCKNRDCFNPKHLSIKIYKDSD